MTFSFRPELRQARRAHWFGVAIAFLFATAVAQSQALGARDRVLRDEKETDQYCANISASVEAARLERERKQLAEIEAQLATRVAALEARQNDLQGLVDKLDAFQRKCNEALVSLYTRMKPEAAAAQLAQLDDEVAAALILELKAKVSSAILGEMEATRGAALVKRVAELRSAAGERRR